MNQPDRRTARLLAQESLAKGDPIGWFETLYDQAEGLASNVPWADMRVNPHFASWLGRGALEGRGKRALVIGCGLGDDAEELAALGFAVTAFDISATAIAWCRQRFPRTSVDYRVADLLQPPADWRGAFDFVLEVYTLQVLPPEPRATAARHLVEFVVPGGTLLIVARGREPSDDSGAMPWPLTRDELRGLEAQGLHLLAFEDFFDAEDPPVRRFRVQLRRQA
jgi:SAM-dependent methyltransferase